MKTLIAVCFLFSAPVWAGSRSHPAKQEPPPDPGYVFALGAANQFLHSWQSGDLARGMILLSDRIRHSLNPDTLEQLFSNGTDRGFELSRGHGHPGRYSFPVVLVTSRSSKITRKSSEIILIETGKNDWVVDRLP